MIQIDYREVKWNSYAEVVDASLKDQVIPNCCVLSWLTGSKDRVVTMKRRTKTPGNWDTRLVTVGENWLNTQI